MAKYVNVRLVVALLVVARVSVIIGASEARDIGNNSPAEAPSVDPLPEQCNISGPCGVFVQNLILMKAMPTENDGVCCQELVQTTKYCWEKIMELLEDQKIPAFANLHPWAENAWDKCVTLASSPSQAPTMIDISPTQAPKLPEQCRLTGPCAESVANLIVSKALPSKKDVVCCQEIVQTTKYCWEKVMEIIEDPKIPAFANLHPWAEITWDKCVSLTASPSPASMMTGNSPTLAPTWPEKCKISGSSMDILTQLLLTRTLPSQKDVTCCREIIQTGKDCWEKTMEILEDPWAENVWKKCVILTI